MQFCATIRMPVHADIRDVDAVLADPDLCAVLDLSRPVGILMLSVLHFIPDHDDPQAVISAYCDAAASGSFLAISHTGTLADVSPAMTSGASELIETIGERTTTPITTRPRERILDFFGTLQLVPPGLVQIREWRPDSAFMDDEDYAESIPILGGVGRK